MSAAWCVRCGLLAGLPLGRKFLSPLLTFTVALAKYFEICSSASLTRGSETVWPLYSTSAGGFGGGGVHVGGGGVVHRLHQWGPFPEPLDCDGWGAGEACVPRC